MKRAIQIAIACLAVMVATTGQTQAGTIEFSFDGDSSDWPWIGRTFQAGTVTGVMHGLVDNLNGQAPTSIVFTSDVSALGITNTTVTPTVILGGIDISGGVVQSTTGILFNFTDPVVGGIQFRLNYSSIQQANVLHWNGGTGPVAGMGNTDGFGGVEFSTLNGTLGSPVPRTLQHRAARHRWICVGRLRLATQETGCVKRRELKNKEKPPTREHRRFFVARFGLPRMITEPS